MTAPAGWPRSPLPKSPPWLSCVSRRETSRLAWSPACGINNPSDVMIVQALLNKNLLPRCCCWSCQETATTHDLRHCGIPATRRPDAQARRPGDAGGKTIQALVGQAPPSRLSW